jgi:hypothetical protein
VEGEEFGESFGARGLHWEAQIGAGGYSTAPWLGKVCDHFDSFARSFSAALSSAARLRC